MTTRILKTLPFALSALALPYSASSLAAGLDDIWSTPMPIDCTTSSIARSPQVLPRCMEADNIMEHLQMFHDIAMANNGNRAAGLPGYDRSVDYVVEMLENAGYDAELYEFPFNAFYENGPGTLTTVDQTTEYEFDVDFKYMSQTEGGSVSGVVEAVDLDLGAGNGSTSGCEADDFSGFTAGNIALIQRGACSFAQKAENAAAAGAVGAIIFNQGNSEDRKGLINGTLGDGYSGGIPVFFATYDNGVMWSETKGLELAMMADVIREQTTTVNVLAETRHGDPDNIVMVGAHLDSVFEGPGVQDNGSGSAAILEMAIQLQNARVNNKIRFAWWGAEEAGLVGSTDYVQNLSQAEKDRIKVYLNFDMIASPNYANFIYDGDGSSFGLEGPPGSAATEALFEKYFERRKLPAEDTQISFRSDYAQFFLDGIPFGGLFTGAEVLKTEEQEEKFGGEAGVAFDPCYHQECDDINNVNVRALEVNSDAAAYVTAWLARSTIDIDKEIRKAEREKEDEPQMMMLRSAQAFNSSKYDIDHWGKYWIK